MNRIKTPRLMTFLSRALLMGELELERASKLHRTGGKAECSVREKYRELWNAAQGVDPE